MAPRTTDWIPLISCLCILVSCAGWLLYRLDTQSDLNQVRDGDVLGYIEFKSETVKLRPPQAFLWSEAQKDTRFYTQDSIQTGRRAQAHLVFENGSSLQVGPESLILFNKNDQQLELDIAEGDLFFKGSFTATVAGNKLSSDGDSQVKLSLSSVGTLNVQALSGEVEVQNQGITQKISKGQELEAKENSPSKIRELSFVIQEPQPFQSIESEDFEQNIRFEAETFGLLEGNSYYLELSQTKSFDKSQVHPWDNSRKDLHVKLEAGAWHARVKKGRESGLLVSTTQSFFVKRIPSLAWRDVGGRPSRHVRAQGQTLDYFMAWNAIPRAQSYVIALLDSKGQKLHSTRSETNHLQVEDKFTQKLVELWTGEKDSSHSWPIQIEALDDKGVSIVRPFIDELQLVDERPAPEISAIQLSDVDQTSKRMTFRIHTAEQRRPGTQIVYHLMGQEHRIEASDEISFEMDRLAKHARSYTPNIKIHFQASNMKKSRVRTLSFDPLQVALPELIAEQPRLIYPSENSRIFEANRIQLHWESRQNSFYRPEYYVVQLSSKNLKNKFEKSYQTREPHLILKNLKPAEYSWTVTNVWKKNLRGATSSPNFFDVLPQRILQSPTPIRAPASEDSAL